MTRYFFFEISFSSQGSQTENKHFYETALEQIVVSDVDADHMLLKHQGINSDITDYAPGDFQLFKTLRPRQNGRHFPEASFKCIFWNENVWISIAISLKFIL